MDGWHTVVEANLFLLLLAMVDGIDCHSLIIHEKINVI